MMKNLAIAGLLVWEVETGVAPVGRTLAERNIAFECRWARSFALLRMFEGGKGWEILTFLARNPSSPPLDGELICRWDFLAGLVVDYPAVSLLWGNFV